MAMAIDGRMTETSQIMAQNAIYSAETALHL